MKKDVHLKKFQNKYKKIKSQIVKSNIQQLNIIISIQQEITLFKFYFKKFKVIEIKYFSVVLIH